MRPHAPVKYEKQRDDEKAGPGPLPHTPPLFNSTSAVFVNDTLMPPRVSHKERVTLSRKVDECKPLIWPVAYSGALVHYEQAVRLRWGMRWCSTLVGGVPPVRG